MKKLDCDVISETHLEWKVGEFERGESPQKACTSDNQAIRVPRKKDSSNSRFDVKNSHMEDKELIDMLDKDMK